MNEEEITFDEAVVSAMSRVFGPPEMNDKTPTFTWQLVVKASLYLVVPVLVIRLAGEFRPDYVFADGVHHWIAAVNSYILNVGRLVGLAVAAAVVPLFRSASKSGSVGSAFASTCLSLVSVLGGTAYTQNVVTQYAAEDVINQEELFQSTRWVLLDSAFYWPDDPKAVEETGHASHQPTLEQMRLELETLKVGGFTGLYVFGNPQLELLKMADQMGFAVIQGITIHDPKDVKNERTQDEIRTAIASSDFVDAFVFGHLRAADVDMAELQIELAKLRQRTGKPVTANFLLADYLNARGITATGRKLLNLSDFIVSDLPRPYSHEPASGSPEEAAAAVAKAVDELKDVGIPAILSLVGYPSKGGENFTEENQARFVELVLKIDRGRGLGIAYTNGFDLPWKQRLSEVSPFTPECDANLGFFRTQLSEDESTATFTPKPAVEEFRKQRSGQ